MWINRIYHCTDESVKCTTTSFWQLLVKLNIYLTYWLGNSTPKYLWRKENISPHECSRNLYLKILKARNVLSILKQLVVKNIVAYALKGILNSTKSNRQQRKSPVIIRLHVLKLSCVIINNRWLKEHKIHFTQSIIMNV